MSVDKNKDIFVGGTLHSIATGNIIAHADEIKDDVLNKNQQEINAEIKSKIEELVITGEAGVTREDLANEYHIAGLDDDNNLSITGKVAAEGIKIDEILPKTTTAEIGTTTNKFNKIHVNEVKATTVTADKHVGEVDTNYVKAINATNTKIGDAEKSFVDGYITNLHTNKINDILVNNIQTKDNSYSKAETDAAIKVVSDKVTSNTNNIGTLNTTLTNSYYTKSQTDTQIANKIQEVVGTAPEALDTLGEIADALSSNDDAISAINGVLEGKANSSDVYTKNEVDNSVNTLTNNLNGLAADYESLNTEVTENTTNISNLIAKKADKVDVYTKIEVDNAIQDVIDSAISDLAGDIYYYHASLTASANKTLIEKGVNTEVTLTVKSSLKDKYAKEITCSPNVALTGTTNAQKTGTVTISDTTSYTFTGVFDYNITKTAKVTITATYPIYSLSSTKTTLTSADITSGTKKVASNAGGNYSMTLTSNASYFWICVPSNMSINKVTLSGFNVPMEAPVNVSVTGKGTYKCYRSTNTNDAGTYTLSVS